MTNPFNALPALADGRLPGAATVSARELHVFLDVGRDFSTWIKGRIEKYGFRPDHDFVIEAGLSSPNRVNSKARQQETVEYHISITMAKELCMVEDNDKGREYRRYLISVEESQKPLTPMEMLVVQAQAMVALERKQAITNAKADKALELATIAEAKAQATAMACQDYSIMAYSRLCNTPVDLNTARALGVRAGKISRERGLPVGKARDPRFGTVNTYVESVLQEVFTEGL
jgi:phage anti-repressor protein